jgi:ribose transport system permease protein
MMSIATLGVAAAGVTFVLMSGGLDLSLESVMACSSVAIGLALATYKLPDGVALPLAVVVGMAIGALNGGISVWGRINPIITTLATLAVFKGVAQVTSGNGLIAITLEQGSYLRLIGFGSVLGVPFPFIIMLAVYILLWFVLSRTVFGRNLYAVGGNPTGARLVGINVPHYRFLVFVIMGACAGLASLMISARAQVGWANAGVGYLFTAITAVILGGTSLAGGRGSAWGTLMAVLLLGTLTNGLNLMQVHPYWQGVAAGALLLLAVGLDLLRSRYLTQRK